MPCVSADFRSCGSPIDPDEPIFSKFQRCYYCGRRHPLGGAWTLTTVPVVAAAAIGAFAIWWTNLLS